MIILSLQHDPALPLCDNQHQPQKNSSKIDLQVTITITIITLMIIIVTNHIHHISIYFQVDINLENCAKLSW